MKKLVLLAAAVIVSAGAYAQGTINFINKATGVDAPVFIGDTASGVKAAGSGFNAQLFAGPDANSLVAVGAVANFLTGAGAGYFNGGARTIPTVAPGATAFLQIVGTDVATGLQGRSAVFQVVTGGAGSPPSLPANMVGATSFAIPTVPEPTTLALGALSLGALMLRRRK